MAKPPYMKLYPEDWLVNPSVRMCSLSAVGVWIDLLCGMFDLGGKEEICGSIDGLARLARCTPDELLEAISELKANGVATTMIKNNQITVKQGPNWNKHKS